jgi:hypothetical protein
MIMKHVVVLMAFAAASLQGSTIYTFVGTGLPSTPLTFQLTVPSAVNPQLDTGFTFFSCSQLITNANCQSALTAPFGAVTFSNQSNSPAGFSAIITFATVDNGEFVFFFPTGAFSTPGVYSADERVVGGNPATLIVSPEPTSQIEVAGALALALFGSRAWRKRMRKTA